MRGEKESAMDSAIKEGGWTLEIEEDPNSGQSDQQETRQCYCWHGVLFCSSRLVFCVLNIVLDACK